MKDFYGNFDFFTSPDPTNGMQYDRSIVCIKLTYLRLREICRSKHGSEHGPDELYEQRCCIMGC